jgi:NAD(P)-dependent dehydrogenase (short-subunit alcohol dehydrogenase family)
MERTEGRMAVVTGGTGALGRWVVKILLENGHRVHVPWIREKEAEELRAFLGPAGGEAVLVESDLTSVTAVEALFDAVRRDGAGLDVLCNLAGGFKAAPIEDTTPEDWERLMSVNVGTAFLCCRSAVGLMKASGGGRIVNVTALPAVNRGAAGMAAYAASKAALLNLTYSLAQELRKNRITVNALAPEVIDTPANRKAMPDADPTRWVTPQEVARIIAFLTGPDGGAVTGSVLPLQRG